MKDRGLKKQTLKGKENGVGDKGVSIALERLRKVIVSRKQENDAKKHSEYKKYIT